MDSLQSGKFLSLIPEQHKVAVIKDDTAIASAPASPETLPVDQVDKTRRSSSSASAASMSGDPISELQGKQFLKLGQ